MPTPAPRTPICIARGNLADLQASLGDIQDGEICYAYDENAHYMKAFGSLTKVAGGSSGGFSGDYNDLTNKPSIGAGVITIKQGGTTKGSFNVNQTSAGEINLDAGGGSSYTLPPATPSVLGGIKVGSGLSVTGDGTLSADGSGGGSYTLPPATNVVLGGIKVGGGLAVTADGTLSANAGDGYTLPAATAGELGGIKVGSGLAINTGVLSVTLEQGTVFKGSADFTDVGAEPKSPKNGWIYSNTTAGTAVWTGISGETVEEGVQAIWSADDSKWSLIVSAGSGVTAVTGTAPITVDIATNGADQPIVSVDNGTESAVGVVQFATDTQIANGTALVAVQASQLSSTLADLVLDGGTY